MNKRPFRYCLIALITAFAAVMIMVFFIRRSRIMPATECLAFSDPVDESALTAAVLEEVKQNPFSDLSVPTYLTKVEDTYFLVDCYHDQVIYHDNLTDPLWQWNVMTDEINRGHTLASDGIVYLIDDTENNRIMILRKKTAVSCIHRPFPISETDLTILFMMKKRILFTHGAP